MHRATTLVALTLAAFSPFAAALDKNAPAPVPQGAYTIDKSHTSLLFRVNHLGFSSFTGRFTRVDARLQFNPANLTASSVSVTIEPASIESDNAPAGFLAMLSGKDWLDAGQFPALTFRSKSVELAGANNLRIHGDLTLRGVTRPVVLEARYNGGYAGHPLDPHARIGFSAHGKFKRSDFGLSIGIPAPGTTMGVGDEVEVILESEFSGPALGNGP